MAQDEGVTVIFAEVWKHTQIFRHVQLKEGFAQLIQPFLITTITEITGNTAFEIQHKREIYPDL